MNKREIELETRKTLNTLVELVLLMDTKLDMLLGLDMILGSEGETKSSESDTKKLKIQAKK